MLEVNKFMMNGEQIDFQDAEAREEINTQVERLDGRVDDVNEQLTSEATRLDGRVDTVNERLTSEALRLDNKIDSKPNIDDNSTSTSNTWSSSKINSEIQGAGGGGAEIDDSDITLNKTWSSSNIFAQDSSIRENIAPLNILTTAERTYNAGEYLINASKLYKVRVNIAIGDTITEGVNVDETDIATELNNLGGGGMPDLNYTTPLFTFNYEDDIKTYTATKECYLVGQIQGSSSNAISLNINGNTIAASTTSTCPYIYQIKLNKGDIVSIDGRYPIALSASSLHILDTL